MTSVRIAERSSLQRPSLPSTRPSATIVASRPSSGSVAGAIAAQASPVAASMASNADVRIADVNFANANSLEEEQRVP